MKFAKIDTIPTMTSAISKPNAMPAETPPVHREHERDAAEHQHPESGRRRGVHHHVGADTRWYRAIVGASPIPSRNVNA